MQCHAKAFDETERMSAAMFKLHATFSNRNATLLAKFDSNLMYLVA